MPPASLSIVSVVFEDPAFWERNVALTASLNRDGGYRWIVVDNSARPVVRAPAGADITLVEGVPRPRSADLGSLHHALALEKALAHADTRFVLLLDHDFFVIRRDWVDAVLSHMTAEGLALFGSVWHPRWFYQYRDFPSVHFMLIDTERIPLDDLDLRPLITADRWWRLINDERIPLPRVLRDTLKAQRIRDSGWQVYRRFAHAPDIRHETLTPHFVRPPAGRALWERRLSRVLPDSWLKFPASDDCCTPESLLRHRSPQAYEHGWEEFFWGGDPFAFHLRRVGRDMTGDDTIGDTSLLDPLLADIRDGFAS